MRYNVKSKLCRNKHINDLRMFMDVLYMLTTDGIRFCMTNNDTVSFVIWCYHSVSVWLC